MEIALIGYVLYASFILIWCSLSGPSLEHFVISPALLEQWSLGRSDMIVFELHPDGECQPPMATGTDILTATPSSLKGLLDWIPPESTLVLCNHGLSSRSVQVIEQRLVLQNLSRVYWLEELPVGMSTGASGQNAMN